MSTHTILPWVAGELSSADPLDGGCFEDTGGFNGSVSRCDIFLGGGSAGFRSPTWDVAPELWFHGTCFPNLGETAGGILQLYDGATVVLQIDSAVAGAWTIKTLQGGVLTIAGTLNPFGGPTGSLTTIDVRVVAGASGVVEGYLEGTQIFRTTGLDHTGFAGVTQAQSRGPNGGFGWRWSQVICDAISHVGHALVTLAVDTASVINTGWTGGVSNINEIQYDDSHAVTSNTAGQVSTYYKNAASLGSWNVVAICIGARAQLNAGSPTNMQLCLRTNGTNYFGPTTALDFGFQAVCASWTVNPFTGDPWDPVTAAAVEAGMKSIA